MSEEVGVRACAKESEQGEACRDNHPPRARSWAPSKGHGSRGREDADGAEHRCRGSHQVVVSAVGDGGKGVAADASEQD